MIQGRGPRPQFGTNEIRNLRYPFFPASSPHTRGSRGTLDNQYRRSKEKNEGFYTEVVREWDTETETGERVHLSESTSWQMQPLSTPLCTGRPDSSGDGRAVSHITQHTTQSSCGSQKCPSQGSANYDKQAKSNLQLRMAQELRIVFTFLKCCQVSKQTVTKKTMLQRPSVAHKA